MKKEQSIELRKKVQEYARQGYNNSNISRKLGVSRPFVIKWRKEKNIGIEARGWKKGKKRKYTDQQEQMIVETRKDLEEKFFLVHKQYCENFHLRIFPVIL